MEVKGITDLLENLEDGQLEVDLTDELQKSSKPSASRLRTARPRRRAGRCPYHWTL